VIRRDVWYAGDGAGPQVTGTRAALTRPRALWCGLIAVMTIARGAATDLRCPPRLPGPHPGFDQAGPVPAGHWLPRRMRLFNNPVGDGATAELAPANIIQDRDDFLATWRFAGGEELLMLCVYNGSGTYYYARPRPLPPRCTMRNDIGLTQAWCEEP
jgi:hypothetical protein